MWETDALSTVFNIVEDEIEGDEERVVGAAWFDRFRSQLVEWKNERIEGVARKPGGALWRQMKDNANDLSSTAQSGVVQLFKQFKALAAQLPQLRLHLIGHSAGAIVHTFLAPRAIERRLDVATLSLLAPAVRVDIFNERLGDLIKDRKIPVLVANLIDVAERADSTCKPYGHSLLYLVSRAFEGGRGDVPLLGMEKHLVPAIAASDWGAQVTHLGSPGIAYRPADPATEATSHGGMDDDVAVQDAVIRHIKGGRDWDGSVVRDRELFRR
jgi:hypothetical protein